MSKAKIAIACLVSRRVPILKTHIAQLSKCTYKDFHLYVLTENLPNEYKTLIAEHFPNNATVVDHFVPSDMNYMEKIHHVISMDHEYSVKFDEDSVLTADGWDRMFSLIESMGEEDLFCTGAITNGIPACDYYIDNFIDSVDRTILKNMFSFTTFGNMGFADYTSLNKVQTPGSWDMDKFYDAVKKINHHYLGIHPVRSNFMAQKFLNDSILRGLPNTMQPINSKIVRSKDHPYFCDTFFGLRTNDWKTIVSRKDLFVDVYDEVPLNRYWKETGKNMVMDTGIPIWHTMYNWSQKWDYENNLIEQINRVYA